jgi:hypothetical protein
MAMSDQHMRDGEKNEKNKDNTRRGFEGTAGTAHRDNSSHKDPSSDSSGGNQGGMMDMARNVGEQAWAAASNPVATAQDLARRAGEHTVEQSQRAGEYLTRNVNEYPLAALMVAGAIGYGIAYLVHSNWQSQGWNRSNDGERRDRRHDNNSNRQQHRS